MNHLKIQGGTARFLFYAENGVGPYLCHSCSEEVLPQWDSQYKTLPRSRQILVHHSNQGLVAMHFGCHTRHHRLGQKHSLTTLNRMRKTSKGRQLNVEARAKIGKASRQTWSDLNYQIRMSKAHRGFQHSEETKQRMSRSQKLRWQKRNGLADRMATPEDLMGGTP